MVIPTVTGVSISSDAGDDDTYLLGETIRVTLTFSEEVDVTGYTAVEDRHGPRRVGREAGRSTTSGGGTASLTFAHAVVEPNISTQGIAVLADTLELNGGAIKFCSVTDRRRPVPHRAGPQPQPQGGLAADTSQPGPGDQRHRPSTTTGSPEDNNAPSGALLVWKPFHDQVFTDPDGDELTYSSLQSQTTRAIMLEDIVVIRLTKTSRSRPEDGLRGLERTIRVFFQDGRTDD